MAAPTRSGLLERARERLAFDHVHDRGTAAMVLAFAVVSGVYASWLLADLRLRSVAFVVVAVGAAYLLYARPTRVGVAVRGLYGLALLLVLTPVTLNLTFLLLGSGTGQIGNVVPFVLSVVDLIYLVVFGLFAAVPAGVAFLLDRRYGGE